MDHQKNTNIYPNHAFPDRPSIPHTATASPPFVAKVVPFNPVCYQNSYYPPQYSSSNYGCIGNYDTAASVPPAGSHYMNDYRPSRESYRNLETMNNARVNKSVSIDACNYSSIYTDRGNSPLAQPEQKLQASAKVFVPQEIQNQSVVINEVNSNSLQSSSVATLDKNAHETTKQESTYNNKRNNSARPKDVTSKTLGYRKHWSNSKSSQKFQGSNRKNFSPSDNPAQYNDSGSYPRGGTQSGMNNSQSSRNQDSRRKFQNNFKDTNYHYNNRPNHFYQDNSYQRRENQFQRSSEWRRSNDPNNYDYNNYHSGRKSGGQDYKNNWERYKPPKSYMDGATNNFEGNRQYVNYNQRPKKKQGPLNSKSGYSAGAVSSPNKTFNDGPGKENILDEKKKNLKREENSEIKEIAISLNQDGKTQRESMIEILSKGVYECMVCCEVIRQQHAIWSCSKCYNCFHLGCTKKWAGASQTGEPGWRCPTCQNLNSKIPNAYFCFCKKMREPEWNRKEIPHSCGDICGRKRENEWCFHKCVILCHPGPCPDCNAFIKRLCPCGKDSREMKCAQTTPYLCQNKCGRPLNCSVHFCEKSCHVGDCDSCSVIKEQECYCGKEKKKEECNKETAVIESFSCNAICDKTLSCGHHQCKEICHPDSCKPCDRAVETTTTCPCGKLNLDHNNKDKDSSTRKSCLDPIPTCGKVCDKKLPCGTPGQFHTCASECHEGACPPCNDQTAVKCRCGFMDKMIPCVDLVSKADEVTCQKQCKKLRQCGRHKCGTKCCIDIDHLCTRVCGRTLKCKLHKCQEQCHRGNCPRCWETSFEELSCHCGASVLYPPIPCGTEPPACELPCRRRQSCSHPVSHNCHADDKCPPCTTLVTKPCFGEHTTMKSTPCYVSAMSCGEQCARKLPCGVHLCQKVCHPGLCTEGGACTQKCTETRASCEHLCNNPCHSGPCPKTQCKEMVTVTCVCGNRKVEMPCAQNEREYKSMATSRLASELHSLNSGGSVDISQIFSSGGNKTEKMKRLECNDECGLLARNRQLALALQITNPDARESLGTAAGGTLYTDSMKEDAKKDFQFAKMVHSTLSDLVMKAKQSKQKSRSHSFAPMNRDKRRFIHEYAKVFGCQSQAYDEEPKKNVVVTACRIMSRLPPMSVVAVIQKEQGQRKAPGPVISRKGLGSDENNDVQLCRLEKNGSFDKMREDTGTPSATPSKEQTPIIDYFDLS